jgi:hypothetical protein
MLRRRYLSKVDVPQSLVRFQPVSDGIPLGGLKVGQVQLVLTLLSTGRVVSTRNIWRLTIVGGLLQIERESSGALRPTSFPSLRSSPWERLISASGVEGSSRVSCPLGGYAADIRCLSSGLERDMQSAVGDAVS